MSAIDIQFKQSFLGLEFDIEVSIPYQGVTAIVGPSGAGKTTFINVMSGLIQPDEGRIEMAGNILFCSASQIHIPTYQRRLGYVFQEARLFPHYRVKGNLRYGVDTPDSAYFDKIVKLLALDDLLERYPVRLSGGEKQRVAIGRALLSKPSLLLMDEPLASLDRRRKAEVLPFLERLATEVDTPIIYVSHSLNEVARLADHLVILNKGKVIDSGPIATVWSSDAMLPWQPLRQHNTLWKAMVMGEHQGLTQLALRGGLALWVPRLNRQPRERVSLHIQAEDVSVSLQAPRQSSIRNVVPVVILAIETPCLQSEQDSVLVKLAIDDEHCLWSSITHWAKDELGLRVGLAVYAQIQTINVDLDSPGLCY
ncbi:molybdenum ABC transporter ATP-binding protein ModC [Vibrio ostreicida]|uniref:Molybdenum ABC transporter ATP-binding protein ModC n=1 Tax=Vibrio ostreicida TaxID=526588 RepID=A0ABT8BWV2_9VIBR|nr:molybdenum ABC transporter ATP-binding protein ModC [Vibrio ostreicida]MDN3611672.1 molybdenum ABC transporter ATP-binding protein ModC [Vibrio ostreicida]NPD10129.1 molybdenum ABC transporter ATP-binding protein ModC [Vibrio ostreicida]